MKTKFVGAGFLLILIAWLFQGFDSPFTGIALVAGMFLLLLGCIRWVRKLPWYIPLTIGGILVAAAYFAGAYIPRRISDSSEDMPGALINLAYFALGVPGIVLMLAGVASACWRSYHR